MVYVRVNNTGERIFISSIKNNMTIQDIITSLANIQYPYKLMYSNKILNDIPGTLISELNISEETTITLFNTYKSDLAALDNEIVSLKIIINDSKKNGDNEKNINFQLKQKYDNEIKSLQNLNSQQKQKYDNEILSLKNTNVQQKQNHSSEINSLSASKNYENNLLNEQIKSLQKQLEYIKLDIKHEKDLTEITETLLNQEKAKNFVLSNKNNNIALGPQRRTPSYPYNPRPSRDWS